MTSDRSGFFKLCVGLALFGALLTWTQELQAQEDQVVSFQVGLSHERCHEVRVEARECVLYPVKMDTIKVDLATGYGFHELERVDEETGAQFNVYLSLVDQKDWGVYDLHVAIRTRSEGQEFWVFNKVRVKSFDDLNELVLHGQKIEKDGFEHDAFVHLSR